MSADVHVLHQSKASPSQVLAEALALAQQGQLSDVVIISTFADGRLDLSYSKCSGQDLAAAALVVDAAARKALEIT